jgi:hypothetical protein
MRPLAARRRRNPSRILQPAMTAIDLLYGNAAEARQIIGDFKPAMTKDSYLAFASGLFEGEWYGGAEIA